MSFSKLNHAALIPLALVLGFAGVIVQGVAPMVTAFLVVAAVAALAARALGAMFDRKTIAFANAAFGLRPAGFITLAATLVVSLPVATFATMYAIARTDTADIVIAGISAVVFAASFVLLNRYFNAKTNLVTGRRAARYATAE